MRIEYTDVLVVGGGLAGLRTAVGAARRGLRVEVLSLVPVKRSHSVAAQGGMQASLGNDLATQLDLERDLMRELGKSHDYAEGVTAFLEKRAPRFTGR